VSSNRELNPDKIEALARRALQEDIENFDSNTLSRLNQARHFALNQKQRRSYWQWLPVAATGTCAALAIAIFLPITQPETSNSFAEVVGSSAAFVVMEDPELLEDLDMMRWLLDEEPHAS
jgi:hypothetical protein